jgi:hypothetical protein
MRFAFGDHWIFLEKTIHIDSGEVLVQYRVCIVKSRMRLGFSAKEEKPVKK